MEEWFRLVQDKNQLLRKENELMIQQRELQLQVSTLEEEFLENNDNYEFWI